MTKTSQRARLRGAFAALALLALPGATPPPPVDDAAATVRTLAELDRRVFRIGTPLARAAAPLCASGWSSGVLIELASQYDGAYRAAAADYFGSARLPVVHDVIAPAPARLRGASIAAIDGHAIPDGTGFARSRAVADLLDAAASDGRIDLALAGGSGTSTETIVPQRACPARFDVRPGDAVDANANGTYVQITSGLVQQVDNTGLAALLAHELVHNILGHPALLARIGGGILPGFTRAGRTMRATEIQADRVSLYILARTGYAPESIVAFWRDFARKHDLGLLSDRTHPDWRTRVAALEEEAARIAAMRARGADVLPPPELLQPVARNQR